MDDRWWENVRQLGRTTRMDCWLAVWKERNKEGITRFTYIPWSIESCDQKQTLTEMGDIRNKGRGVVIGDCFISIDDGKIRSSAGPVFIIVTESWLGFFDFLCQPRFYELPNLFLVLNKCIFISA